MRKPPMAALRGHSIEGDCGQALEARAKAQQARTGLQDEGFVSSSRRMLRQARQRVGCQQGTVAIVWEQFFVTIAGRRHRLKLLLTSD